MNHRQAGKGDSGAIKAETCDECQTYLKIMSMDRDPNIDPTRLKIWPPCPSTS
ncbi:MAG: formate dehydrogenase accessory protein FdhE [Desulfocapsaceae bacterium]|nr:formate dehydrogenase accessory protein FdhE [Desulfocapsaceae bacterium]